MGIRSKFLMILIFFSVFPLVSFYLINLELFNKIGEDLSNIATVLLLQSTARELQDSADNHRNNLDREFAALVRHGEIFRDDVNRLLVQLETGSHQSSQGTRERVARQLEHSFSTMHVSHNSIFSLGYFSKDGFTLTYPADRNRGAAESSFRDAVLSATAASRRPLWVLPEAGNSGGFDVPRVSICMVVHGDQGAVPGVVVVDIDIVSLLEAVKPASLWSGYKKSLLLGSGSGEASGTGFPLVIGTRNQGSTTTEWRPEMTPFAPAQSLGEETTALFQGMHYGEAGYVSLPYEGEMSLWAYSQTRAGPKLGILEILPEREALYRIARHPGRLGRWMTLDSLLIVSVVIIIMVVVVAYRSRRMLEPFFSLVAAFKNVAGGDFSTRLTFETKDERQMVAGAFNNMTLQLEDGMRMRQGLEVAREVQQNFFPEIKPGRLDLDVGVSMSYCEETGGDYIDILDGNEECLCIVVGDVTGHGIGAALHVAALRAFIRGRYEVDIDLASVVTYVNGKLTTDMGHSGRFVTLFIIEINPVSKRLHWVRAGHDPAWLCRSSDGSIVSLCGDGVILGVDGDFVYSANDYDQLKPGDVIVIGTDGIWETCDPDGKLFGKSRVEQIVSGNAHKTASGICNALLSAVSHFRGEQKQEDDVSIVVIKIPGS